jgi:hypothetical protein
MGILVALSVRFYLQANNNSLPKRQDREPLVPILLSAAKASPLDIDSSPADTKWVESLPVRMVAAEITDSKGSTGTSHVKAVDLILAARQLSRGGAIPPTESAKDPAAPELKIDSPADFRIAIPEPDRGPVTSLSELELRPVQDGTASPLVADDDEHRLRIEQEDRQFLDSLDLPPANPSPSPARLGIPDLYPNETALGDPESLLPTALATPDTRESDKTEIPTPPATELQMTPAPENVPPLLDPVVQLAATGPATASIGDTSTAPVNDDQARAAASIQEETSGDGAIPARA